MAIAGAFPEDSHEPIAYPFAVTSSGDTKDARALLDFMARPVATAIFVKYGFVAEGE